MPHPRIPQSQQEEEFLTRLAAAGRTGARLMDISDGPPSVRVATVAQKLTLDGFVERSPTGIYTITAVGEARLAKNGRVKISTDLDKIRGRGHSQVAPAKETPPVAVDGASATGFRSPSGGGV